MKNIHTLSILAENMRRLRKAKHLTQEELADRTGLHPYFIGLIERKTKTPSLESMEKISRALDTSVAELVSGEETHEFNIRDARGREAAHVLDFLPSEKADALLVLMKFVAEKFIETDVKRTARAAEREGVWVTKKTATKKSRRRTS